MSSLGESEIIIDARVRGLFRILDVASERAIEPTITFRADCELRNFESRDLAGERTANISFELTDLAGELFLQEGGPTIAPLLWLDDRGHMRSTDNPIRRTLQLKARLGYFALEQIERIREGKSPRFIVKLWPTVVSNGTLLAASVNPIRVEVPRDRWVAVVAEAQQRPIEIFEVLLPESSELLIPGAAKCVEEALRALNDGNFLNVAIQCRSALEIVGRMLKESDLHLDGSAEVWSKKYREVVSAMRDVMSLSVHPLDLRPTRSEARFFVATTVSLVALLSRLVPTKLGSPKL